MIGGALASYHPGTDDIAFLSATTDLMPNLEVAQDAIAILASLQNIPMMALLKLATFRMTSAARWDLTKFGHVVVKNDTRVARSVKREGAKREDPKYSLEPQDVRAMLNSMEAFTIAGLGLPAVLDDLLHRTILTTGEVLSLFRNVASLFAKYHSLVTVTSLVMLFKNQLARYFTAFRYFPLGSAKVPPPKLDAEIEIFQRSLDTFEISANQKFGGKVKTGEYKGQPDPRQDSNTH